MQPRQFNMLALGAVISLIAAGVVHSAYNGFEEETVSGKRLFPTLETKGDATAQIAIQKGADKLTLKKSTDGKVWSIVERAGYPVDAKKVRELVVKLGQTELIERKTSDKDLYAQLDLDDPAAKDAKGKLVRLGDKDNKTIAELIVGRERRAAFGAGKSGTYVRSPGDPQSWLARLELNASTEVVDWVDPVFFKVDETKIDKIVVKQGDKVVYTLGHAAKKKDEKKGAYALVEVPSGMTQNTKLRLDDLVNGVKTLEMTDVREARDSDAKPDMTAEISLDDGAKYLVGLKREGEKRWITIGVPASGKDDAAKKLREATKGWSFEIANWRAEQTFKKAEEVFETAKVEAPKLSVAPGTNSDAKPAPATTARGARPLPSAVTAPTVDQRGQPGAASPSRTEPETAKEKAPPEPANADVPRKN